MEIPKTKRGGDVDQIDGISIPDSYRWLENNDQDVADWINAQNRHADLFLRNNVFEKFSSELVNNFKIINFSTPLLVKGRYFYMERQPDEDQMILYIKNGLDGTPVKLIDPNGKNKDNTISIDYWDVSRTGKYLAYGLSEGGDEMATLYIVDIDTNEHLSESIARCRHSSICWLPDDSGFFYTRNPKTGTVPKNEEHLHTKVYFHKLGNNPDNDELIFGADRPKDDMISLSLSIDGRYLGVNVSRTWTENEIFIYNTETGLIVPLITGIPAKFSIYFLSDKTLIRTNYKANNYRLLSTALDELFKPITDWEEFLPESKHLLESVRLTKDKILVEYLTNACSEVIILNYSGKKIGNIPMPQYSSLTGISSIATESEFFYGIESFTFPKISYRYNPETDQYKLYRKIDNPINPDDYLTKQEWYQSKDGTRVPIFIFHRKDVVLNGKNPTQLYGYGGFAANMTPAFMRNQVPWFEGGGIFAVANIRGGNEFGENWHKQSQKENKQKSFDDFISAAEFLISQKYTDANHLGIIGASNGGLLVCVVAVQRPDLFKAVCSRVPLTDMARFSKFGVAIRWVHEYGNPEIKSELENILKWSPYHNVKVGVEYPNFFFTTADKDMRVDPLHARKMTALLQSVSKENKVLLFTEMKAGHGPGRPISKIVEVQALILTFFSQELNLKI